MTERDTMDMLTGFPDWLGRTLLVVCVVAMVALVLGAIVLVLKWLFIIVALPLVRYVFHLSTLVKMVATLGILVMWFSTEVMRHGLQFAVARARWLFASARRSHRFWARLP